jgi:predicted PurR-regulated permease PerM
MLERRHFERVFRPPPWLRDLGMMALFLVALLALLIGVVWILGLTSTIVEPVAVGAVVAVVTSPIVGRLQLPRVPRDAGAAIVPVSLIAIVVRLAALVIGGTVDQATQIKSSLNDSLNTIEEWFNDAGATNTAGAHKNVIAAISGSGSTVLQGLANGIRTLTSLVFFLTFTAFTSSSCARTATASAAGSIVISGCRSTSPS